jgi:hypothetical protein
MSNQPNVTECTLVIALARLNQGRLAMQEAERVLAEARKGFLFVDSECGTAYSLAEILAGPLTDILRSLEELADDYPHRFELLPQERVDAKVANAMAAAEAGDEIPFGGIPVDSIL